MIETGLKPSIINAEDLNIHPVSRDQIAGKICPVCKSEGAKIGAKQGAPIRACLCGNLLSWTWGSEEEYFEWYSQPNEYHSNQQLEEGQKSYWERDAELVEASKVRLPFIRALRPNAKTLIDIGAGTGAFIAACKHFGLSAIGIEPNLKMCDTYRSPVGGYRNLVHGSWESFKGKYDLITVLDVFEHLTRPKECLVKLRDSLIEGGILMIEMPESGCPQHLRDGIDWKHIRPKQHICLYSDSSAQRLFCSLGFQVEMVHRPVRGTLGKIAYFLRINDLN